MPEQQDTKLLKTDQFQGAAADFAAYCEAEFERRRNSEEPFDEAGYREAMEMTLRRLRTLEDEGHA